MSEQLSGFSYEDIRRWGVKSSLSILDQGIHAGANFVVSILLARWLLPAEFGIYALSMAVIQYGYQLQNAMILEPMSVLGTSNYSNELTLYLSRQTELHHRIIFPFGLLILIFSLSFIGFGGEEIVGRAFAFLGLFLTFMLLPWTSRRIFYVLGRPEFSVIGSALYAFVLILSLVVLHHTLLITVELSLVLIAIAGFVSYIFLRRWMPKSKDNNHLSFGILLKQNWDYGKWRIVSSILVATASQAQLFVSGYMLGLLEVGIIRAVQNLMQPMSIVVASLGALGLPVMSRDYGKRDFTALKRKTKLMTFVLTGIALIYLVFLFIFKSRLELLLYGGRFSSYVDLIPIWGIVPVLLALNSGISYALQAIQKPASVFYVAIIWAPVSLISAVLFISLWGLWGATYSALFSYTIAVVSFGVLYQKWFAKDRIADVTS